jgi:phosphomannomutase
MTLKLQADYNKAFKAADIRGVYPTEIDDELVYFVARAFVEEFKYKKIVVGRDMRLSTPGLFDAFVKGANDSGADVIDIGSVHSPALYFASATLDLPGVMITASHSPAKYNGLKLIHAQAIPLTDKSGLNKIKSRIKKGKFVDAKPVGKKKTKKVLTAYKNFVFKKIHKKDLSGISVLADTGNGMAGVLLPLMKEKLPIKLTVMNEKLDGSFPSRDSDPTLIKNQKPLRTELKSGKYDFGIAFDGDADRVAFLDEKGRYINSAVMGGLIARRLLEKNPQAKIGYTILTSRSYLESIKEAGGKPDLMKVGHAFIKDKMRQHDVLFACEHSGHFYFKDFFYTDSVTMTILSVLESYKEARKSGQTFSQMMKPYLIYKQTEDVVVEVRDKKASLAKVEAFLLQMKPHKLKRFDGLVVDFGSVWGAVKPSVTEHALKIMFESKDKKQAEALQTKLVEYIKSIA